MRKVASKYNINLSYTYKDVTFYLSFAKQRVVGFVLYWSNQHIKCCDSRSKMCWYQCKGGKWLFLKTYIASCVSMSVKKVVKQDAFIYYKNLS